MHSKTWALAAAFALALSGASAEPSRPRIYYPRQVKRQVENTTEDDTTTTKKGLLDNIIDLDGDETATETATKSKDETSKSKDSILLGPTGIVIPGLIGDDETTTTPKPTDGKHNTTATEEPQSTATSTKDGFHLSDIFGKPTETTSSTSSKSTKPSKTATGTGGSSNTKATAEPTTTSGALLPSLISDIFGPTGSDTTSKPSHTGNSTLTPTPTISGSGAPTSTSSGNSVTDILPSLTLFPPESTTSTPTSKPETTSGSIPTDSIPTDTPTSGVPTPTDGPTSSTSSDLPEVPTPTSSPDTPTDTPEPPPVNSTAEPTEPTTTPTVLPPTSEPTKTPVPSTPSTIIVPSSSSEETPIPVPTTSQKPKPVTSIEPTATFSNTEDWMPTTIVADPTSFTYTRPTNEPTGTKTEELPTDIPKVILSNDPDRPIPEGSVQIQIGFDYAMNYNHVAKNPIAAAQIFKYLPVALSFAGGFKMDKVMVSMLVPYDTREKWGYVTTIAKVYYPKALVDTLKMDLLQPNSDLYNNANHLVNDLTADINPNIDIYGNIVEGDDGNNDNGNNNDDGGSNNDAIDSGDSGDSSAKKQATTAGIAVGAVGLSVMYGAAMFIVARRYKRKRQAHRRSNSLSGSEASSEMQYAGNGSPAMMGGALLSQDGTNYGGAGGRDSHGSGNNSARTANISAPVATENSLGWN